MNPIKFNEMTHTFTAPPDHDSVLHGEIADLPVMDDGIALTSVWMPSDEERDIIAKGGAVTVSIMGRTQPPIAIGAVKIAVPPIPKS